MAGEMPDPPPPAAEATQATPATARHRLRWRRLRAFLLFLVFLALVAFWQLPALSARALADALGRFFHRPVTVGEVRYHLAPLEAEVLDLRVAGPTPEAPPFLQVARVRLVPSLQSLWSGRTIVLRQLRLERPVVRIHAYPQGGDDIPKMGGGTGGGMGFRIQRLVLADGAFVLDHERVPLDLDLPDFDGRLFNQGGRVLEGRLSFAPGRLQFGSLPPLPVGTELLLTLDGPRVRAREGHLRAQGTDLAYQGELLLRGRPTGTFSLHGRIDLEMLDTHVTRTGFGMKGDGSFDGSLKVEGSRLDIEGRLSGVAGEFDGVPVPTFDTWLTRDARGLQLRDLKLSALDGSGRLDLELPPPPAPAHLRADLEGVDAEGLWRTIFDWGEAGLAAAATGRIDINWPRGRIRQLSGTIALDPAERQDRRTPLSGRFEWQAQGGDQRLELADLRTPHTRARLSGRIDPHDRTDLQVEAHSVDLAAADELSQRLRRALGTAEAQKAGFSGSGSFRGKWVGTLQAPLYEGRATARDLGYLGVDWGQAEWSGSADAWQVQSRSLVLRHDGAELWVDGRIELGEYGREDGLELQVRLRDWPAEDFVRAYQWQLDLRGGVSGQLEVRGRRSAPVGSLRLGLARGRYYGLPFEGLEVEGRLLGQHVEVARGQARLGGGALRFHGTGTLDGVYDGRAELDQVDVEGLLPEGWRGPRPGGRLSGEVTLLGPLDRPRLQARLRSPRLFLGDEGLGALEASARGLGDGRLSLEAHLRSARVDLALQGSLGAAAPYTADLRLEARDTSLDPFAREALPGLPAALGLVASGSLTLEGPLLEPRQLRAEVELPELLLQLPDYAVRNRRPLRLVLASGRLVARDLALVAEGTDLSIGGSAALLENGPLELSVRGAADLRALTAVTRRLRGQGAARLSLEVGGERDAPRLDGRLELDGAGLRVRNFPHGLEGLTGLVRFSERSAEFEGLEGTLGGGPVSLRGRVAYAAGQLSSLDVGLLGRGLTLRVPEGLRSVVDADLRLFGDAQRQWLSGRVDVRQALWSKRYDLANELLATGRPAGAAGAVPLAAGLRYDLKLSVPGTLRIDNNLATLSARAELDVSGSYDQPVVTGRAEIERGRVYFQGNTYVIRRGSLEFANAERIDPLFDIEAETRVRSYRVTLRVNGTLERVYPTLTSDPPLSAVQILNLLAGADEATVSSLTQSQTDQARLAAAGAATLAAGKLSEDLGLERGAERLLGLNRFSIDPAVVRSGLGGPTARLTVGKRITSDLGVQYSLDLRAAEDHVLTIEYTLSDRLSLLLTQAEPGGLAFDVRLRQTR